MKRKSKIGKVVLVVMLLLTLVMSTVCPSEKVYAQEEMLSVYLASNTHNWYGGAYSTNNPFAQSNLYGQCTWYAYGRAYELTGAKLPCRGNANTWYSVAQSNGWSVGSTPRANSVVVWNSGSYGHVGYVESVNGDTITVSEANNGYLGKMTLDQQYSLDAGIQYYSGTSNWTTTTIKNRYSGESLIGYIYLTENTTPGALTISAKSSYYSTEDVVVSWNTPANTTKYGFTLRYNPSTGELVDHYVTGNSYNLGKLSAGNYRLWMAPYNANGDRGTAVYVDFSVVNHSHSYTGKVTKAATCTAKGVRTYTCACGASYTEEIAKVAHTEVVDAAVAATCTKDGKTQGSHCSVCNAVIKAQTTVAKKGHSYTGKVTKTATCTAKGVKTYTCACGASYTEEIAMNAHTVVVDAAVAATCTKDGKTQGSHCSVCNTVITAQTTIKKTGHSYTTVITKATVGKEGKEAEICESCGYEISSTIPAPETLSLSQDTYTYTGSYCKPEVTVIDSAGDEIVASNYTVSYSKNKNPGTATVAVEFKGNYYSGTLTKNFTIKKCEHNYTSKITKASVGKNGKIVKTCSLCENQTTSSIAAPTTLSLATTEYTYSGTNKKPKVTVKDSNGKVISASHYTVSYSNNKNVGKATVTVKFKGSSYSGTLKETFTIVPKNTSLSKLVAKKKGMTVQWKAKTTQVTGYQIQYSTNKNFSNAKNVTVSSNKTTSKSITKLNASKKYYVRIRTYKTVKINGKNTKLYSKWSGVKTVVTKK